MIDLTVMLENVPGKLAELGETLGNNEINMEGLCGFPIKDDSFLMHILVEDATKTREILEKAGFKIHTEREVIVLTGRPGRNVILEAGTGGKLARKISSVGVNIDLMYFAGLNRLIVGVDDIEKAKAALG